MGLSLSTPAINRDPAPRTNEITKLDDFIKKIQSLDLKDFFSKQHPIGSEIDEIKFGLQVLDMAVKTESLPQEFFTRAAFRVLQLLNNELIEEFKGKDELKALMVEIYRILQTEEMPAAEDVQYNVKYDNALFHVRDNSDYYEFLKKTGLENHFNSKELSLTDSQKIISRLNYYLINFNFPHAWLGKFRILLTYTNDHTITREIFTTVQGLLPGAEFAILDPDSEPGRDKVQMPANFDPFVQLWILVNIVLRDLQREKNHELPSCYYPQTEYNQLLIAIAAKLPANLVLKHLEDYLRYAKEHGIEPELLQAPFDRFEKIYEKIRLNRKKMPDYSVEKNLLNLLAKTLCDTRNPELSTVGKYILQALEHDNIASALVFTQELKMLTRDGLNRFFGNEKMAEVFENMLADIEARFFVSVDGKKQIKKEWLPKGLNGDFSIEPVLLLGNKADLLILQKNVLDSFGENGGVNAHLQEPNEKESACTLHLEFNLLSKTRDEITDLLSKTIDLIKGFLDELHNQFLQSLKTRHILDRATVPQNAINDFLKEHEVIEKKFSSIFDTLNLSYNRLVEFKDNFENEIHLCNHANGLARAAVEELEAILIFHQYSDLSLLQKNPSNSPRNNESGFFSRRNPKGKEEDGFLNELGEEAAENLDVTEEVARANPDLSP